MPRTKRGKTKKKRKKKVLKETKGYKWGRKSKYKQAKEALQHARKYAYRDRKTKKREFRKLWQTQINAACRQYDLNYSRFIYGLKQKNIALDRKILAILAREHPTVFKKIVDKVKKVLKKEKEK